MNLLGRIWASFADRGQAAAQIGIHEKREKEALRRVQELESELETERATNAELRREVAVHRRLADRTPRRTVLQSLDVNGAGEVLRFISTFGGDAALRALCAAVQQSEQRVRWIIDKLESSRLIEFEGGGDTFMPGPHDGPRVSYQATEAGRDALEEEGLLE